MKVVHILWLLLCLSLAGGCKTSVSQNISAGELSDDPSADYSEEPSYDSSVEPTSDPSEEPTSDPSCEISYDPTDDPSYGPTDDPSEQGGAIDVGIDGWEDDSEDYGGDVYD